MGSISRPDRVSARQLLGRIADPSQSDVDAELRSAIVIHLIAERPEGASVGELAALTLGGRKPTEEVGRVAAAVSRLEQEGEVTWDGSKVFPVIHRPDEPQDVGGGNGI